MAGPGPAAELVQEHAYRARAVAEPRAVLREFGVELDDDVEIRVWDSSAEVRYLVLPMRPAGTEGWSEDELRALVTPRLHDRHRRPGLPTTTRCERRLAAVDAALAGHAPLPRDNGELVFEEPWQGRALGMGVVVLERTGDVVGRSSASTWSRRSSAPAGVADETAATAYYGAWLDAVEALLASPAIRPRFGTSEELRPADCVIADRCVPAGAREGPASKDAPAANAL